MTNASFIAFLDQHARATPDAPALAFGARSVSWAELHARVDRLAGALRALGLPPGEGSRVFVLDKNHPATVELSLACARAGIVCVIGNWRLAPDEVVWAINDSGARVLFAGDDFAALIGSVRAQLPNVKHVVVVGGAHDGFEPLVAGGAPVAPIEPRADDTVVQLYTSGTTGFPKGAMLTHRSIGAHTETMRRVFDFKSASVNLVPMPLFHVGGIAWALLGLRSGGVTVIARDPSPPALVADIERYKVTHTFVVPAILQGLVAMPDLASRDLSSVDTVLYGASPIAVPLLKKVRAALPCKLCQVYGMTEMSGVISILDDAAHRDADHEERLASAGKVAPGIELRVVDPSSGADLPPGAQGELLWKSAQCMKGYWGKPDATAEAFTADGWLKSGDAGVVDDGGFVFIRDRIKDMVITGGENVYPAEVERVLQHHPAVADVAVFGVPDEKWGESLRAAVVLHKDNGDASADAIIAYAREQLAHYKCPRAVDFVDALPRNASGKVLKRQLREPFWVGHTRKI